MAEIAFAVARSIYRVPVELIDMDMDAALRPLDEAWVAALMVLFGGPTGQETPIEIWPKANGRYGMTKGRHRLAAALRLGWPTIDADIQDRATLLRKQSEIAENLFKLDLSPLDRAAFVAAQIAVAKALAGVDTSASPQSVAATARWADRIGAEADDASRNVRLAFGFNEEVAATLNLSRATIFRDLELHRGLKPEVVEAIRTLPVASNASQLRALARLPETEQREVAGMLVEGQAKGVSDAVAFLKQAPVKSAAQKAVSAIRGNWGRLSERELKALIRDLPMPRGVVLVIDGETIGGEA